MIPPRVVLDTGVFIAQHGSGLRGGSVWRFIETGRIIPLVSRATYLELRAKLSDPRFSVSAAERDSILAEYLSYAEYTATVPASDAGIGRDEGDRPFVELAMAKEADALITLDRGLLACDGCWGFPVVNVAGLAALVRVG